MIKQLGISKKITAAAELPNLEHLYKNNENLEKHNKFNVSINCNELLFSSTFFNPLERKSWLQFYNIL